MNESKIRIYSPETPFADERRPECWDYAEYEAGQTIREMIGPDAEISAKIHGRELSGLFIDKARLKAGTVVYVRPVPQASLALAAGAVIAAGAAGTAGGLAAVGFSCLSTAIAISNQFKAETTV